ncbi:MAG: ABC transporter ATP-binding protein [Proteobacteria bacterium]|nr:MAG: ABC transporter ATP-binding protein [Pseudomonadota bacterium]QKK10714.1 MAG: ABC transporter ATP-binding protein [Pseudomonadota bacterium]
MDNAMLTLSDVHTHIAQYHILQGVNLTVPRNGTTMLLGRNGAGKTTTMRTIIGLWRASQGAINFDGEEITSTATPDIAQRGIAYVPENMGIFSDLSVRENLLLAATSGAIDEQRLQWLVGIFPALGTFWNSRAGNLSGGQKQMLAIGRAVIEPRRLILIDEPSKGLAPAIVNALIEAVLELKAMQTTILMVEQNFHMASAVGDTVAVMDDGRIIHSGTMAELVDDTALQARLLGLSMDSHQ